MIARRSEKIDLLKKVPLFNNLKKRHLNEIAKQSDEMRVKAGKTLVKQGKKGDTFFLIIVGEARVEKDQSEIRRLSAGDFFGEISLIDGEPRTATVIAESDMTLLVLHKKTFNLLLQKIPGLQENVILSLCKYLRRAEQVIMLSRTSLEYQARAMITPLRATSNP